MSSVARNLQIYGGDVETNWQAHRTEVLIEEHIRIYQIEIWVGIQRGHRGDVIGAVWIRRKGTEVDEGPLHVRAWDHYSDESKDGLLKNLTPFYVEVFPGDTLVVTSFGAQMNTPPASIGTHWKMLTVAHLLFTAAS